MGSRPKRRHLKAFLLVFSRQLASCFGVRNAVGGGAAIQALVLGGGLGDVVDDGGDNFDQHCMTMDLLDDDDENMELVNNGDGGLL